MDRKFFIVDSHEEIKFGDRIGLSYEKKHADGAESAYMEFEFVPELIDMLLDDGVIEEVKTESSESKEQNGQTDKIISDLVTMVNKLFTTVEILNEKVISLEKDVRELKKKPALKKVARKVAELKS